MVDLTGHETGNGGYSQRTPTALPGLLYSERETRVESDGPLKVLEGHPDGGLGLIVEQQMASFEIGGIGLPAELRGGLRRCAALAQPDVDTSRDRLGHI